MPSNHNHRPCRWYAQAPLGPFTSRAYRLIELSFACVSCPATADAVICTPLLAPSDEGAGFCGAKDWGREYSSSCFSPSVFAYGESTSLIRGRLSAAAELGIAKAFWNHRHYRWVSLTNKKIRPSARIFASIKVNTLDFSC